VVLLLLEGVLRNEHWEVGVLSAGFLEPLVEERLNLLPDVEGPRSQNVAPGYLVVVDQLSLGDHLLVPLSEVNVFLKEDGELVPCRPLLLLLLFPELLLLGRQLTLLLRVVCLDWLLRSDRSS